MKWLHQGATTVCLTDDARVMSVSFRGHTGASIEKCVDPDLDKLGLPTIEQLKKANGDLWNEEGSPSYMYLFTLPNHDRNNTTA